jgi:predicted NBD/HSP70 family sugar kinase
MAFDDDLVLGIDVGTSGLFAGLIDASGRPHGERAGNHGGPNGPGEDRVLDALVDVARALVVEAESSGSRVRGVGVGVPGVTRADGMVASPPLGWREMPLGPRLSEELDLPVCLDNDVNLAALGELHFGAGRGARNLVCVSVGNGMGAALILDGKLYRGHRGAAGNIGVMLPGPAYLDWSDDRWGPLESLASGPGIAARARELAERAGMPVPPDGLRAEDVFAAALNGASWAGEILDEMIDPLAVSLAAIQTLLDPERIILGGSKTAGLALLGPLTRRLAGAMAHPPTLVRSELGYRAAVLGAAVAVRASL